MMTTNEIENLLNKLYWSDPYMYQKKLQEVKDARYKVMRNSKGEHKVKLSLNDLLGGLFNNGLF